MARAAWVTAFVALPLVPVVLLVGTGEQSELEPAVVLGLVGVSAIIGTIVVSSRLRSLTSGLGIEQLLAVHRWLGLVVVGLVLAHVAAVIIPNPSASNISTCCTPRRACAPPPSRRSRWSSSP